MRPVLWIAASALAASLLLMSAGCRGGNKAGGESGRRTIVLTFASQIRGGPPDQLIAFANRVTSLSGGAMRIDFKSNWRAMKYKSTEAVMAMFGLRTSAHSTAGSKLN